MAELTPPTPPPADKGNGAHVWVLPKSNPNPQGSIPAPAGGPGYGPYGGGACFFGYGPYSYGYQCLTPAQPQPQPQVNVSGNGFVENRGKVEMEVVQGHTSVFALVRRGTGVFHPPPDHFHFQTTTKPEERGKSKELIRLGEAETPLKGMMAWLSRRNINIRHLLR